MRRSHGVNRVNLIVEGVDSDWPEQWSEEETSFLNRSDRPIKALRSPKPQQS
ncbi:MAG: hypothetical protein WCD18_08995 [Thermosynechococcaceae cyanobacterium]